MNRPSRSKAAEHRSYLLVLGVVTLIFFTLPYAATAVGLFMSLHLHGLFVIGPLAGLVGSFLTVFFWSKLVPMSCIGGGNILTSTLSMLIVFNSVLIGAASIVLLCVTISQSVGFGR